MTDPTDRNRDFITSLLAGKKPEPEAMTDEERATVSGLFTLPTQQSDETEGDRARRIFNQ